MLKIRPVSDLRNKFPEIEDLVIREDEPIVLTKNGYGSMVLMSINQYSLLSENVEEKLDEADKEASKTKVRYTKEEVFKRARKRVRK